MVSQVYCECHSSWFSLGGFKTCCAYQNEANEHNQMVETLQADLADAYELVSEMESLKQELADKDLQLQAQQVQVDAQVWTHHSWCHTGMVCCPHIHFLLFKRSRLKQRGCNDAIEEPQFIALCFVVPARHPPDCFGRSGS